jgi:GrpB-like predicted nucleotidyltransferase (UPF0157 family)
VEVVVERHNPGWAGKFDRESQLVTRALDPTVVAIHHIGSTAIAMIYAKPIIDMLVEVTSVDEVDSRNVAMASLGYEAMGEFGIAGRRYFCKDSDAGVREYQVHVFVAGSSDIERHIAFRDFMQAHPELAKRYSDLKRQLADEHRRDIEQYTDGKDGFIKEMERKALAWRRSA